MFTTLLKAVKSGNLAEIEQFMNEERETIQLTSQEGRELFKEAIVSTNYEIIQALINGRILENGNSPREYLKPLNGRTIFGYAVFEKFDEGAIKILSSSGYDMLCYSECAEFVLKLIESYNPDDLSGFITYLDRLKIILSMCPNDFVQNTLRKMLYNESIIPEVMHSVEWLKCHFRYGYGVSKFRTINKIHMEMGEGKWSDAVNSILSLDENEVNENIYESFPPGENVPRWTILSYAVSKGKSDIVNLLINRGADVNKHSERVQDGRLIKFTPFELAVELNFFECCRLLVENGSNLYLQSSNSMGNILRNAVRHENLALLKLILENRRYSDDDIQLCYDDVEREVRGVNIQAQMTECLKVYKRFEKTEITNAIKAMLLFHDGTQQEALDCIRELSVDDLGEEIRPFSSWRQSWTLLTYAAKLNKLTIVEALLNRGCDINQSTRLMPYSNECTIKGALIFAVENNNYGMCKLLLNAGALLYHDNNSAFPYAFRQKNQQILKLLVERLEDSCHVFREYASFVDISSSVNDIVDTFSVDLLSFILQKARISVDLWFNLIQECSLRTCFKNGAKRGRHYFLNLLLNFLPFAPKELQTALSMFNERNEHIRTSLMHHKTSFKERDWLQTNVVRCSSLQNLCRFTIRQAVHPFTESSVQSLGFPVLLQEYLLEHPLRKISAHLTTDDLSGLLIEQQGERFYLYVDHETNKP
ncbi:uncharacterized protein LOC123528774 isoform X2 [Mercenaria mercenaria]|nr:uncharacterized protein LOC123528774 isoform X2 [Mercenaria mercenaria]XP_053377551.1 uncharacterized protein LOC123528774 isoform X2 [Mercenaria mercenaria]